MTAGKLSEMEMAAAQQRKKMAMEARNKRSRSKLRELSYLNDYRFMMYPGCTRVVVQGVTSHLMSGE